MTALLRTAVLPLRHSLLPVALAAGVLLSIVTVGWLDGGRALVVLRWIEVLLAVGWLSAVDDPCGEVVAASPYSRCLRTASRLVVAAALVVPAWCAAALLVHARQPSFPVLRVGLEGLALAALGIAIAAVLRFALDLHLPAQLAALGLVAAFVVTDALPRWYALQVQQTWGPPWVAAHLRWAAVLLLGAAIAGAAVRDPLARRSPNRG